MTSRGACSTRTTATWRAASTTSSSAPAATIHGLEKLVTKAEQRYTEVGSELAKHFVTPFQKAKHPIKGLLRQRDVFEKQVKPQLGRGQGRLRLGGCPAVRDGPGTVHGCSRTTSSWTLQPALGTMPTITEIGMAALLPKAHESAKVVAVGGGKLGAGDRRHGHQGPQGPGRLPEGPRRRARSSTPSSTTCCPSRRRRSRTASRAPSWS